MRTALYYVFVAFGAVTAAFSSYAFSADYDVDVSHSHVGFEVKHMMISDVEGVFKDFEGNFKFDEKKPQDSEVTFSAKTASISTDFQKRDDHLRSAEFFDADKYPTLTFKSTKVTASAGGKKLKVLGNLTIHGVTKLVTFDVEYKGSVKDPWGNNRVAFTATASINRKAFGLRWNKKLDGGGVLVGDKVSVNLKIEAVEKKAGQNG